MSENEKEDKTCSNCSHGTVCEFERKLWNLVSKEGSHYFYENGMNKGCEYCRNIAIICRHYIKREE